MRKPSLETDGWQLEDGEELHAQYPTTFLIPHLDVRRILQTGDFAKLVLSIGVEAASEPKFERMWVIVRERIPEGYLGILDNNPTCIEENEELWRGTELPFEPKHIIAVEHASAASIAIAAQRPARPWS